MVVAAVALGRGTWLLAHLGFSMVPLTEVMPRSLTLCLFPAEDTDNSHAPADATVLSPSLHGSLHTPLPLYTGLGFAVLRCTSLALRSALRRLVLLSCGLQGGLAERLKVVQTDVTLCTKFACVPHYPLLAMSKPMTSSIKVWHVTKVLK